jgi:hypothetical protein
MNYYEMKLGFCQKHYSTECDNWIDVLSKSNLRIDDYEQRCYDRYINPIKEYDKLVSSTEKYEKRELRIESIINKNRYLKEAFAISLTEFILRSKELKTLFPERYDYFKNHLGFKTL